MLPLLVLVLDRNSRSLRVRNFFPPLVLSRTLVPLLVLDETLSLLLAMLLVGNLSPLQVMLLVMNLFPLLELGRDPVSPLVPGRIIN